MNSIQIELQENHGRFAARAAWGMSCWHRDPISAISELFGYALVPAVQFANRAAEEYDNAAPDDDRTVSSGPI